MGRSRSIDLLFEGNFQDQHHCIAIEMKCYRALAASGGARGATDIFMKGVSTSPKLRHTELGEIREFLVYGSTR